MSARSALGARPRGDRRWTRYCASLLIVCTAGCATIAEVPPDRSYAGRFSAVATQGERREAVSGRFTLEVRGPRQTVDLATPIGTTLARIELGPDGARATGPGLETAQGANADELTEKLLGWRLPVGGLGDWIEGRPVDGRPAQIERENGTIATIHQDGWTVRVAERFQSGGRPRLLVFERAAAAIAPAVVVRLVLDGPAD